MGDTFILKCKKDNEILTKFEMTSEIENMFCGDCYSAIAWAAFDKKEVLNWEFVCHAYCKFDGCSHWWFYGEDFHDGNDFVNDANSYYHLCGPECVFAHVRDICFVWKVAEQWLSEAYPNIDIYDYYGDHERLNQIIDIILDDYIIEKA